MRSWHFAVVTGALVVAAKTSAMGMVVVPMVIKIIFLEKNKEMEERYFK